MAPDVGARRVRFGRRFPHVGGILVDAGQQLRGLGRAAVVQALSLLRTETGHTSFALSYRPDNVVARQLYASLGFVETGEEEDGELVARLSLG